MHVLVTGAAGMVGSATVARLLAARHTVRAWDRVVVPPADGVEVVSGELADESAIRDALHDVDAVVHLAAGRWGDGVDLRTSLEGSVAATTLLYQAVVTTGIGRVVLMSSAAVLTGHPRGTRLDRDTPPAFQGAYPMAKWLQEEVARRSVASGPSGRLVSPILRPWVVVDATTRRLRTGVPIDLERDPIAHDGCFGWIDRHDLADACLLALVAPLEGAPVFHLMANPIGRALVDCEPAERELGWRPRHDFAEDIPNGWRMPDGWPMAADRGAPA